MSKAIKSFLRGMGHTLDIGGTMVQVRPRSTSYTQGAALRSYWRTVGGYMKTAERDYKKLTRQLSSKS